MTIDTTGFKVVKLSPAVPEGAVWVEMSRYQGGNKASGVDGSMRKVKHSRPVRALEDDFGVGSSKHCELLDLGGSLVADDLGLVDAPYLTEPLNVLRADDPHAVKGYGMSKGGYHHRDRGIRGEVNRGA